MQTPFSEVVLDREQFRSVTLGDEDLMREILAALISDTSRQLGLLGRAIRDCDRDGARRLAHYSKGACANVGANTAAVLLQRIERDAALGDMESCSRDLAALGTELEKLRGEQSTL